MGATNLFLVSSLALLALSSAEYSYCSHTVAGQITCRAVPLANVIAPPGISTWSIPDYVCDQYDMHKVGVETTACSSLEPAPVSYFPDLNTLIVTNQNSDAMVSTIAYCGFISTPQA